MNSFYVVLEGNVGFIMFDDGGERFSEACCYSYFNRFFFCFFFFQLYKFDRFLKFNIVLFILFRLIGMLCRHLFCGVYSDYVTNNSLPSIKQHLLLYMKSQSAVQRTVALHVLSNWWEGSLVSCFCVDCILIGKCL